MIQGGRGLAAALGGAQVYKHLDYYNEWLPEKNSAAAARRWRTLFDRSDVEADQFGVRADDARRVLG